MYSAFSTSRYKALKKIESSERGTDIDTKERSTTLNIKNSLVSPSPTVMADVAGVQIGCILDTGSEVSIIPSDVFHSQLTAALGCTEKLGFLVKMTGISETEVPVEGYVHARVCIGDHEAMVGFLVGQKMSTDGKRQDFPILIGSNGLRPLLGEEISDLELAKACLNLASETKQKRAQNVVTGSQQEVVAPRTVRHVQCHLDRSHVENPEDKSGLRLVEKVDCSTSIPFLQVIEGRISGEFAVETLVANTGEVEVTIPPYSNLASATLTEPHNEVSVKLVESSIEVDVHEMLVSTGGELASDSVDHADGKQAQTSYHHEEDWNEDVYEIRPLLGGRLSKVHRKLLVQDPRGDGLSLEVEDFSHRHGNFQDPYNGPS